MKFMFLLYSLFITCKHNRKLAHMHEQNIKSVDEKPLLNNGQP